MNNNIFGNTRNIFGNTEDTQTDITNEDTNVSDFMSLVSSNDGAHVAAVAAREGNDVAKIVNDTQNLNVWDIKSKYGQDVADAISKVRNAQANLGMSDATKESPTYGDYGRSFAAGAINLALGIAGKINEVDDVLTPDAIRSNDRIKETLAGWQEDVTDYKMNNRSPQQVRADELNQLVDTLDLNENQKEYEADLQEMGEFRANLKKFGRDVLDVATNTVNDPTQLINLALEGAGSFVTSAGVGGLATRAVGGAGKFSALVSQALVTGAAEGGSANLSAYNEINKIPTKTLYKNSEEFRDMIDAGVPEEEARKKVADMISSDIGWIAGGLGSVLNLLTGGAAVQRGLVGQGVGSAKFTDIITNAVKESVEESAQTAASELTTDYVLNDQVDDTIEIGRDLGSKLADAAVGGGLVGGGLTVPRAITAVPGRIVDSGRRALEAEQEQNNIAAVEALKTDTDSILDTTANNATTEDTSVGVETFKNNINTIVRLTDDEVSVIPSYVADLVLGSREEGSPNPTRKGTISNLLQIIDDPETELTTEQITNIKSVVSDLSAKPIGMIDDIVSSDLELSEDVVNTLKTLDDEFKTFRTHSTVSEAENTALEVTEAEDIVVSENNINTVISSMAINPDSITSSTVENVQKAVNSGSITLNVDQQKILNNIAVLKEYENSVSELSDEGITKSTIKKINSGNDGLESYNTDTKAVVKEANGYVRTGDNKSFKAVVSNLQKVAEHKKNQAEAFAESAKLGGKPVKYKALQEDGSFKNTGVVKSSVNEDVFKVNLRSEADAVIDAVNTLIDTNDLDLNKVEPVAETVSTTPTPTTNKPTALEGNSSRVRDGLFNNNRKLLNQFKSIVNSFSKDPTESKASRISSWLDKNKAKFTGISERDIDNIINFVKANPTKYLAGLKGESTSTTVENKVTFTAPFNKNNTKAETEVTENTSVENTIVEETEDLSGDITSEELAVIENNNEVVEETNTKDTVALEPVEDTSIEVAEDIITEEISVLEDTDTAPEVIENNTKPEEVSKTSEVVAEETPDSEKWLIPEEDASLGKRVDKEIEAYEKEKDELDNTKGVTKDIHEKLVRNSQVKNNIKFTEDGETNFPKLGDIINKLDKVVSEGSLEPLSDIKEFSNPKDAEKFYPSLSNIVELVNNIKDKLDNTVNEALEQENIKYVTDNDDVLKYDKLHILNLLDNRSVDKDDYKLNDHLVNVAILATLNWLKTESGNSSVLDYKKASEIITKKGKLPIKNLREKIPELMDFTNKPGNTRYSDTIKNLASELQKVWGVKLTSQNARQDTVDSITTSLAMEIIDVLIQSDLIPPVSRTNLLLEREDNGKIVRQKYANINIAGFEDRARNKSAKRTELDNDLKNVNTYLPNFLGNILYSKPRENSYSIGEPLNTDGEDGTNIQRLKRNTSTKVSKTQQDALKKIESIKYFTNEVYTKFIKDLGVEQYVLLQGGKSQAEIDKLTKGGRIGSVLANSKGRMQGIRDGLIREYNNTIQFIEDVENYSKVNDIPVSEVPVYWPMTVTSGNRIMALGHTNPQSSKLMRNVSMATRTVLDLNDPTAVENVWLTIAQGLDLKTEEMSKEDSIKKAKELIEEKFRPVVDDLKKWFSGEEVTNKKSNSPFRKPFKGNVRLKDANLVSILADNELTNHGLNALLDVANLELVLEGDNKDIISNYQHFNFYESDGKANGPTGALYTLMSGLVNMDYSSVLATGRVFTGRDVTTGDKDLYELVAEQGTENINNLRDSFPVGSHLRDQSNTLLAVLQRFGIVIDFVTEDDGSLGIIVDRSGGKKTVTEKFYSSGEEGLSKSLATVLIAEIEDAITNNKHQDYINGAKFIPDMKAIFLKRVNTKNPKRVAYFESKHFDTLTNVKHLVIDNDNFNNLVDAIRYHYTSPMVDAVNDVAYKYIKPSTDVILQVSQLASTIYRAGYLNERNKLLEKYNKDWKAWKDNGGIGRKPNNEWTPSTGLTKADERLIHDKIKSFRPMLDNGYQDIPLRTGKDVIEKNNANLPSVVARSLNVKNMTGSSVPTEHYVPGDAGVGIVPNSNMSNVDAMMMLFAFGDENLQGTPVYDAALLAADNIISGVEKLNKGSKSAMQINPMKQVNEAFMSVLSTDLTGFLNGLDNQSKTDLIEVLKEKRFIRRDVDISDAAIPSAVLSVAYQLGNDLDVITKDIDVKLEALENMEQNNMTGPGKLTNDSNTESPTVAEVGDRQYNEQVRKFGSPTEGFDKELFSAIAEVGMVDDSSGVIRLGGKELGEVIQKNKNKFNDQDMILLQAGLDRATAQEYTIVLGSSKELSNFNSAIKNHSGDSNIVGGAVNFDKRIIYINNSSAETIAHELSHIATIDKIFEFYTRGTKKLEKSDVKAIKSMQAAMDQFMTEASKISEGDTVSYQTQPVMAAYRAINKHLNNIDKNNVRGSQIHRAAALEEFKAWALTNNGVKSYTKSMNFKFNDDGSVFNRIATGVVRAIKKLLHLDDVKVGDDIFSNVYFGARVLTATPFEISNRNVLPILQQSVDNDISVLNYTTTSEKLLDIIANNQPKLPENLDTKADKDNFIKYAVHNNNLESILVGMKDKLVSVKDSIADYTHAFGGSDIANDTFANIQHIFAVDRKLAGESLSQIQDIVFDVFNGLSKDSFNGSDTVKQRKLDFVLSTKSPDLVLAKFIGLVTTNEEFRKIVEGTEITNSSDSKTRGIDKVVGKVLDSGENLLNNASTGVRSSDTVIKKLDKYIQNIFKTEVISKPSKLENIDKTVAESIQNYTAYDPAGNKYAEVVKSVVNKKSFGGYMEGTREYTNTHDNIMTKMFGEIWTQDILGRPSDDLHGQVFDMVIEMKAKVSQARERFREALPTILNNEFKGKVDKDKRSIMFKIGSLDLISLGNFDDFSKLVLNKNDRDNEISRLENYIKSNAGNRRDFIIDKTKELADFMSGEPVTDMVLVNATAVAELSGGVKKPVKATQEMIDNIDKLSSLYALNKLSDEEFNMLSELKNSENDGLKLIFSNIKELKKSEFDKKDSNMTKYSKRKGHMLSENQNSSNIIIAPLADKTKMRSLGYKFLDNYNGSRADNSKDKMGYFLTPVRTVATYNQGAAQTATRSVDGVDLRTGISMNNIAGVINDRVEVAKIIKRLERNRNDKHTENLIPVYSSLGNIVAFERTTNPDNMTGLDNSTDVFKMLGAMYGRQLEEEAALAGNKKLVDVLANIYNKDKELGNEDQYVNLADTNDEIYKDSYSILTRELKEYAAEVFGDGNFFVRKDQVLNAVGTRSPSLGDFFTGKTRVSKEKQKMVRDLLVGTLGVDAYKNVLRAEQFIGEAVTETKLAIVVKSITVPAANILSNGGHLSFILNIPMKKIISGYSKKTVEANTYNKNMVLEMKLKAKIAAEPREEVKDKYRAKIAVLNEVNKKLSIWPLIESGEYTAISMNSLGEDATLDSNSWNSQLEAIVNKIPEGVIRDIGRYGIVSKDTPLYKFLARSVQYGDFIAKSIYYDHMVETGGKTPDEARVKVSEEFVSFNHVSPRTRMIFEKLGMAWFLTFMLRSPKVAAQKIVENPLSVLLYGVGLSMFDWFPDSPLNSNAVYKATVGNGVDYNFGTEMYAAGLESLPVGEAFN